jgi:pimeloyl-ACP methyl ester carboxylesterase
VFQRYLQSHFSQLRKSWYIFFFQMPRLPEFLFSRNNYAPLRNSLRSTSRPGTFTAHDLDRYLEAWAQPGALTGSINWYRAAFQSQPASVADQRLHLPTLVLWGTQDLFLDRELAQLSAEMCDDGRLILLEEATHWILREESEQVSQILADFFQD